jgi:hypothetical protein
MTPNDPRGPVLRFTPQPSPELSGRIRAVVAYDLRPARGLSAGARWALGLAVSAATLLGVAAVTPVAVGRAALITALAVTAVATATYLGLPASFRSVSPKRMRLAVTALAPLVFIAIVAAAQAAFPFKPEPGMAGPSLHRCLGAGALMAVLPLGVVLVLWRRTDPFTPRLTGALIGGWAGVVASASVTVSCACVDPHHVLFAHASALVASTLLGAILGRRVLAP